MNKVYLVSEHKRDAKDYDKRMIFLSLDRAKKYCKDLASSYGIEIKEEVNVTSNDNIPVLIIYTIENEEYDTERIDNNFPFMIEELPFDNTKE